MHPIPLESSSFQVLPPVSRNNQPQRSPRSGISWETVRKIVGVVFIILLVFGVFIPPVMAMPQRTYTSPDQCSNSLQAESSPECLVPRLCGSGSGISANAVPVAPMIKFPSYVSKTMHPGLMSGEKGVLCVIPKNIKLPTFKECNIVSKFVVEFMKKNRPKEYLAAMESKNGQNEKGTTVNHGLKKLPIQQVTIGMNSEKAANFENALAYIEKAVFGDIEVLVKDEKAIVGAIKNTNRILLNRFALNAGEYRKKAVVVAGNDADNNSIIKKLSEKNVNPSDLKHLKSFLAAWVANEPEEILGSAEELEVVRKYFYLPPNVKEIEDEMLTFAKNLKEIIPLIRNQQCSAIAAAAFAHQEIVRIHPFDDANGRTARIWMNTILQIAGEKAIIFPDEEGYAQAVAKDISNPGIFSSYLIKVIEWNRQQESLQS